MAKAKKQKQGKRKERAAPKARKPSELDKPDRKAIEEQEKHDERKADLSPREEKIAEAISAMPPAAETEAAEARRLARLGLKEIQVAGTHLKLVGLAEPDREPVTTEQRLEIARRLNEVGPKLPRYVMHLHDVRQPVSAAKAILHVAENAQFREAEAAKKAEDRRKRAPVPRNPKNLAQGEAAKPAKAAAPAGRAARKDADPGARVAGVSASPGGSIGSLVCKLLLEKKSDEQILAAVLKINPKARTSPSSIAWYRSKLRGEGKLPRP